MAAHTDPGSILSSATKHLRDTGQVISLCCVSVLFLIYRIMLLIETALLGHCEDYDKLSCATWVFAIFLTYEQTDALKC